MPSVKAAYALDFKALRNGRNWELDKTQSLELADILLAKLAKVGSYEDLPQAFIKLEMGELVLYKDGAVKPSNLRHFIFPLGDREVASSVSPNTSIFIDRKAGTFYLSPTMASWERHGSYGVVGPFKLPAKHTAQWKPLHADTHSLNTAELQDRERLVASIASARHSRVKVTHFEGIPSAVFKAKASMVEVAHGTWGTTVNGTIYLQRGNTWTGLHTPKQDDFTPAPR